MPQPRHFLGGLLASTLTLALATPALSPSSPARAVTSAQQSAVIPVRQSAVTPGRLFAASVDTMKESRDTETRPLSDAAIAADVDLAARLNTTYITVDTHWDYPAYMARWVAAVRAAGRHVWFRTHPNQWGDNNGTTGVMTPAQYEESERAFILAIPGLFAAGDILDPCPEPENGPYWIATYGYGWTAGAPNVATRAYNEFIRDTTDIADVALRQEGISGVITTVRSTNSFFATHAGPLEPQTVARMGRVTVDSYPEGTTTDPATAAAARASELDRIEAVWGVPVVIGEMGYSVKVPVDDATQEAVLRAEFAALRARPYLSGINYWVGAGTDQSGGYTRLFAGSHGHWSVRPAAADLAAFYGAMAAAPAPPALSASPTPGATLAGATPIPPAATPTATATIAPPTATATATRTNTPIPPTNTSVPPTVTNTPIPPTATATPAGATEVAIASGGTGAAPFVADTDYQGGTTYATNNAVDTGAVADPAPQVVYRGERYGNFSYSVPRLTPGGAYTVRLHFAEIYWNAAGRRVFDVAINGAPVLSSFDIYAVAGGADRAIVRAFPAVANGAGVITIAYHTEVDNAKSSGIEIIPRT